MIAFCSAAIGLTGASARHLCAGQGRNVLTGSLQDDDVHRHIVVGSSSLGHWHTGVGMRQGKHRNANVHAAVAEAQIAHTESGIVHAPPPEEPEEKRSSLYELVEKRLAEARARSATPVHPSRVNESPVRQGSNLDCVMPLSH